ncbi:MAG: GIY-YIG nuclease family protein [Tannerellaceae bacterium]
MKNFGKTIRLFLIDGDPDERICAELSNWTGKAYRIPRNRIKDTAIRGDLCSIGIYMLFGKTDEQRDLAYIGEAEDIQKRLEQHILGKDFWNIAVAFISKDNNLNKAHAKYMESRLYELAKECDRFELENTTVPTRSSISEAETAEMEEFIENLKILVNTLGYKIFEPYIKKDVAGNNESESLLYIKRGDGDRAVNALGRLTSEGFVVLKDSQMAYSTVSSFSNGAKVLREKLIKEGVIEEIEGRWLFRKDYLFSSPSTAATILLGRSANGRTEWKDASGKSLKEIEGL